MTNASSGVESWPTTPKVDVTMRELDRALPLAALGDFVWQYSKEKGCRKIDHTANVRAALCNS